MEKNNDSIWKKINESQIELESDDDELWDLFLELDELEDYVMGYLIQGNNLPSKNKIINELDNTLDLLDKKKIEKSEFVLLDIKSMKNHILILRELVLTIG